MFPFDDVITAKKAMAALSRASWVMSSSCSVAGFISISSATNMRRCIWSAFVQIMAIIWANTVIVNWTIRNKLMWNFNQNTKLFIRENESENIVCEMAAILSKGRWVNTIRMPKWGRRYHQIQDQILWLSYYMKVFCITAHLRREVVMPSKLVMLCVTVCIHRYKSSTLGQNGRFRKRYFQMHRREWNVCILIKKNRCNLFLMVQLTINEHW